MVAYPKQSITNGKETFVIKVAMVTGESTVKLTTGEGGDHGNGSNKSSHASTSVYM
jgi:hypothetical protein